MDHWDYSIAEEICYAFNMGDEEDAIQQLKETSINPEEFFDVARKAHWLTPPMEKRFREGLK
ncbi:MAG TPA: hypothetical protein V6C65_02350 [Allocoleopsis sp.]